MRTVFIILFTLLLIQISRQHSISPRVANGQTAERDQILFIASIKVQLVKFLPYVHVCAGTIIAAHWIMSTVACLNLISTHKAKVIVNMYYTYTNKNSKKDEPDVQTTTIVNTIPHEDNNGFSYDLSLIQTRDPMKAIIAELNKLENIPTGQLFMAGWGTISSSKKFKSLSKKLQFAEVELMTNTDCGRIMNGNEAPLDNSEICTNSPGKAVTACTGDTGGPLYRYSNGVPEVVGVISWALTPCGQFESPTVSTRVSHFIAWIYKKMGINSTVDVASSSSVA